MTKKESEDIYIAAEQMSNWLFNMKYSEDMKKYSFVMKEMVDKWDANKEPLSKMLAKRNYTKKS